MKFPIHLPTAAILACAWLLPADPAGAQDEELQATLKLGDRRKEGMGKLAERIQNFGFLNYARKLVDKLDKKERKVDPFGMPMDPKQKGGAELVMPVENTEEGPKTSLQEAMSKFRVTGVYPKRKEVIVGAQSLRVGDQVVIKHGESVFNLEIKQVEADSVEVVDQDTGEVAGVTLGIIQALPMGMSRTQPVQRPVDPAEESGAIVPMNREFLTLE